MRGTDLARLVILAIGTMVAAGPVQAQTYDPNFPVCLHVYGPINYYECGYWSLPQCAISASARAAQCVINPYYAGNAYLDAPVRHHRRYRHVY
jgi:hypothetical protein